MSRNSDPDVARPEDIESMLGNQLETLRLGKNITQAQLAEESGVSRRTITRLENGEGTTLDTFIRVLGALGLTQRLATLLPDPGISPIQRIRSKGHQRKRARPKSNTAATPWTWADEHGEQ